MNISSVLIISVRLWGCTTLKIGKPSGQTLYHTTLLASSSLDADPWSIAQACKSPVVMDLGSGLTDGNVLARNSQPA